MHKSAKFWPLNTIIAHGKAENFFYRTLLNGCSLLQSEIYWRSIRNRWPERAEITSSLCRSEQVLCARHEHQERYPRRRGTWLLIQFNARWPGSIYPWWN